MLLTGKTVTGAAVSNGTTFTDALGRVDVLRAWAPSDAAGYTIVEDPASAAAKFPGITRRTARRISSKIWLSPARARLR